MTFYDQFGVAQEQTPVEGIQEYFNDGPAAEHDYLSPEDQVRIDELKESNFRGLFHGIGGLALIGAGAYLNSKGVEVNGKSFGDALSFVGSGWEIAVGVNIVSNVSRSRRIKDRASKIYKRPRNSRAS